MRVLGKLKQTVWKNRENETRKGVEVIASDIAIVNSVPKPAYSGGNTADAPPVRALPPIFCTVLRIGTHLSLIHI